MPILHRQTSVFIAGVCLVFLPGSIAAAPASRLAFQTLDPGAVEPTGWIRDWALAAKDGITGHLDERDVVFAEGWTGKAFQANGIQPQGTGWPLEQCAYWLDGLVRLAYILHDPPLMAKARSRLDPLVDGVLRGGPSFIHWVPRDRLDDSFNNWAHSHIARAMVAYYNATHDERILRALVTVYRDYPLPEFSDQFIRVNGMVNLDPLVETYILTHDDRLLVNAKGALARPGFKHAVDSWSGDAILPGHAVIFYENERVPALGYALTGNTELLGATLRAVAWSDRLHLLPLGVVSGEEYVAGRGSTRNVETCDVAAAAWTYHWLLRITGKGEYADRMEQILFNAGPAPIARDFQTMCYYQSPNRMNALMPAEEPRNPGKGAYTFGPTTHPLCCVGNANRILPNYIMYMWMSTSDDGVAATLYGPSRAHVTVKDGTVVALETRTDYPFGETVAIEVTPEREVSFPLYLRIPGWCRNPKIDVDGITVEAVRDANGFVRLARSWKAGEKIKLRLPMVPRLVVGRETSYPEMNYFRQPESPQTNRLRSRRLAQKTGIHSPFASVLYGPLLFALPIGDDTPNAAAPDAVWNYALDFNGQDPSTGVEVVRENMPQPWRWPLKSPLRLRVPAAKFDWVPDELQPLPVAPVTSSKPARMELVPYGCTKFRISMFPVTRQMWEHQGGQPQP